MVTFISLEERASGRSKSRPRSSRELQPATCPPDLVVFSHLRWAWVWQRPQQLIARLAAARNVWFVEEPFADPEVAEPLTRWTEVAPVTVVTKHVPGPARHIGFDSPEAADLADQVALAADGQVDVAWLYTPLALDAARAIPHRTLVFDVMDDLASFSGASPLLRERHRQALDTADLVFTGGRSLHRDVCAVRPDATLFASGVEPEHYAAAVTLRRHRPRPVAGYIGVIDERLDLELLAQVADRLADWDITVVGPVAKISPTDLPRRPNISYPGAAEYSRLPEIMAGFDVALMPFADNEATRKISPTKTLEYLAAGLPVVSTPVPDVVADFSGIAHLASGSDDFAAACRDVRDLAHDALFHARCRPLLELHHWDRIASRMDTILRHQSAATVESLDASA
jgi:glycosyltransferase involved in cell wall biosynthesis